MWAGVGVLLVGCSAFARTLDFTLPVAGDLDALPVVLRDQTGQVTALGEAPGSRQFATDEGIFAVPGDPKAVVLHWRGGRCDKRVSIDATGAGGLTFTLTTTTSAGACDLAGVSRSLLVVLAHPVDAPRTFFTTVH